MSGRRVRASDYLGGDVEWCVWEDCKHPGPLVVDRPQLTDTPARPADTGVQVPGGHYPPTWRVSRRHQERGR